MDTQQECLLFCTIEGAKKEKKRGKNISVDMLFQKIVFSGFSYYGTNRHPNVK